MTSDARAMLAGAAVLQEAALGATVATAARLAEFAVREAGVAATTLLEALRAPPGSEQRTLELAILRIWEQDVEAFRVLAGAPRFWLLLFIGELDRIRGPRAAPPAGNAADELPGDWSDEGGNQR